MPLKSLLAKIDAKPKSNGALSKASQGLWLRSGV